MAWHRYIWQPFYTLWVAISFIVGILIILPVIALCSIPNNVKSRKRIYHILRGFAWTWLLAVGMPVRRLGSFPNDERYIIVANHISYMDAVVLFVASPGYVRPLGKQEMERVPIFGFIYRQITLLVDRSCAESRSKSMRLMYRAIRHQCHVFIFPEGTFNETPAPITRFYDGAFRLAVNSGHSILPILFLDTVKRYNYTNWWKFSPGLNRVKYLSPIKPMGKGVEAIEQIKLATSTGMAAALEAEGYPYAS